ncbi:amino acid adenylation domain-containing protein [Roseibium marinum]|uniref:amino acid adenylation domain-containing protein n=1 Tax=Roseibium marinum TaxID=281252 RepID=UPI00147296DB|nr:amino acid adenylation domain-containing protein [Roseibium marinum]
MSFCAYRENIAVTCEGFDYSYGDLARRVDDIAASLLEAGCGEGTRICVVLFHNLDLIASVLAILKIGAVYVPIDPRTPDIRVNFIIQDSGSRFVLFSDEYAGVVSGVTIGKICLEEIAEGSPAVTPRSSGKGLAYILYTSGSTGRPKGVEITHENLLNYCLWASRTYFDAEDDRIALYSTLAFDFTVTCIFPPLMRGASIAVVDGVNNPMAIQEIVDDYSINIIKITPSYLFLLSTMIDDSSSLRRLIVGGEDLAASLAEKVQERLGPDAEIVNEYGPTEATVGCITHTFDPETDIGGSVPIGRPMGDMEAYVVDGGANVIEDGREGELYLAGPGLASGYVNLPEQTRQAFTSLSALPGRRVYKTGDLARRNPDGNLVFLGRIDDQVKIRGNRVELSEVAAAIRAYPRAENTYVTAVPELGTYSLVGVVTGSPELRKADLLEALRRQLPAYMVPTTLEVIDEIPMTANQKVDRDSVLKILGKT